jgi:hypothetical protein
MGDVFLRNYYAIHDLEQSRLGLVPHRYSKARVIPTTLMNVNMSYPIDPVVIPPLGPRHTDPFRDSLLKVTISLIFFIILILVPALIVTVVSFYWNNTFGKSS